MDTISLDDMVRGPDAPINLYFRAIGTRSIYANGNFERTISQHMCRSVSTHAIHLKLVVLLDLSTEYKMPNVRAELLP